MEVLGVTLHKEKGRAEQITAPFEIIVTKASRDADEEALRAIDAELSNVTPSSMIGDRSE